MNRFPRACIVASALGAIIACCFLGGCKSGRAHHRMAESCPEFAFAMTPEVDGAVGGVISVLVGLDKPAKAGEAFRVEYGVWRKADSASIDAMTLLDNPPSQVEPGEGMIATSFPVRVRAGVTGDHLVTVAVRCNTHGAHARFDVSGGGNESSDGTVRGAGAARYAMAPGGGQPADWRAESCPEFATVFPGTARPGDSVVVLVRMSSGGGGFKPGYSLRYEGEAPGQIRDISGILEPGFPIAGQLYAISDSVGWFPLQIKDSELLRSETDKGTYTVTLDFGSTNCTNRVRSVSFDIVQVNSPIGAPKSGVRSPR